MVAGWYEAIGPDAWDWYRLPPLPSIPLKREFDYYVSAGHRWGLPGLDCPKCGVWTGRLPLPAFDLSKFSREDELRSGWAAKPSEFETLVKELRTFLGASLDGRIRLSPGTYFGPLVGSGKGRKCGQFAYVLSSILCAAEAADLLRGSGVRLVTGPNAELSFTGKLNPKPTLVEIHAEPLALLDPKKIKMNGSPCDLCGRDSIDKVDEDVLLKESIPPGLDVVRSESWNSKVYVSERFRQAVLEANLGPMKFRPVTLA